MTFSVDWKEFQAEPHFFRCNLATQFGPFDIVLTYVTTVYDPFLGKLELGANV